MLFSFTGSPPRETKASNKNSNKSQQNQNINSSALNSQGSGNTLDPHLPSNAGVDRATSPIQNLVPASLDSREGAVGQGLQEVVKKFAHEKKSSRQV